MRRPHDKIFVVDVMLNDVWTGHMKLSVKRWVAMAKGPEEAVRKVTGGIFEEMYESGQSLHVTSRGLVRAMLRDSNGWKDD